MEPEIITLVVVSIIGSIGSLLSILHLKKCHSGCMDSECLKGNTPSATPLLNSACGRGSGGNDPLKNELITHQSSGLRLL